MARTVLEGPAQESPRSHLLAAALYPARELVIASEPHTAEKGKDTALRAEGARWAPPLIVAVAHVGLTGVQAHPHPYRSRLGPGLCSQGLLGNKSSSGRCRGRAERSSHPVAHGREHPAAVIRHRRCDELIVQSQRCTHVVRCRLPQARRPLNIGEQKRHRPRRNPHNDNRPTPAHLEPNAVPSRLKADARRPSRTASPVGLSQG